MDGKTRDNVNTLSYHEKKRHKEKEHCKHSYSVVLYNNIHGYTLKEKKPQQRPLPLTKTNNSLHQSSFSPPLSPGHIQ